MKFLGEDSMKYKYILFDLDGTLTDPGLGITNGVVYALKQYGIEENDRTKLYKFIGPPIKNSFMEFYGMSESDSLECVKQYRKYYGDKGLYENVVYEDIPGVLEELKKQGATLLVATSKPTEFSIKILDKFGLLKYFDFVIGSSMDGNNAEKSTIISNALSKISCSLEQVIMVGDRKFDIIGAHENGISSIGVLYGYGGIEELTDACADFICNEPKSLLEILL